MVEDLPYRRFTRSSIHSRHVFGTEGCPSQGNRSLYGRSEELMVVHKVATALARLSPRGKVERTVGLAAKVRGDLHS